MTMTNTKRSVYVTATLDPNRPTETLTKTPGPTGTHLFTMTPTSTPTPSATLNSTQQTWRNTAVAFSSTQGALQEQLRNEKETQVAKFLVECDEGYSGDVSPDGNWIAASCGYKRNQRLIVQNKQGTKWVVYFKDLVAPILVADGQVSIMGGAYPEFWSPDGAYLYLSTSLGYSGGGNQCFPGFGSYGLFRLNLKNGNWTTLIPPHDNFPGDEIKFSLTGRRYATDINGVMITDLTTGEVTQINSLGVINLNWSPDGSYLAYSLASCDEADGLVQSSSVYIWEAATKEIHLLYESKDLLLSSEIWLDASTLRLLGEKRVGLDTYYNIFLFNVETTQLLSSSTATPYP